MKAKFRNYIGLAWITALVAVLMGVAGCGGNGAASNPGTPVSGDHIIFDNGQTGTVSETARTNDVVAVTAVITANPSVTASKMAQLLVAKMQTLPDFRAGGISTSGDPWGEFKDGSIYAILVSDPDFFKLSPSTPVAKNTIVKPAPLKPIARPTSAGATNFPGSTKAYIIHGVEAARTSPSAQLSGELTQAGYSVTMTNGGVADWSQITGAGILVNDGHGASVLGKFYVSTTDVETPVLDTQYASYIKSKAMIVAAITVFNSAGQKHTEQRYLLSIDYLKSLPNYSSMFSTNSFFMDVVCSGDSKEAANFWGALQSGAGLGDYSGWSLPVDEVAATQTADFFFDRVLGLNQTPPIDPASPPPATVAATAALLATTSRGERSSSNMNQEGSGNVFSFHYKGSLNYIIPSIATVTPSSDGANWLVDGAFGSDQGTVSSGGAPVTPSSWTDTEIIIPSQSTSGAIVVKSPTGLISNAFKSLGKPTLSPLSSKIQQGGQQVLKVTVADGLKGATYMYQWSNTAKYGAIADASGHKGKGFTTSNNSVTYTPSPNLYGTDTITEQTFLAQTDGTMVSIGKATATVEVDPSGTLSINPTSASIDQTKKQPILVSVKGGVAGATYSYNWSNTANFGTIADAQGHSGKTFTSPLAAVTYTPNGTAGSDTVTVEVFVVAADNTLHSLGPQECEISVGIKSLIFTPSDGTVAVSQTQVFSVAPLTGNFPSGATFAWDLAGKGTINGKATVTTTVPQVTYKATSTIGAASLDVTVKDSKGKTIATGELDITIELYSISPKTASFNGPGQFSKFGVSGTFAPGTKFKWACKYGGFSATGAPPYTTTLTTTTAGTWYGVGNPPPDGSAATDDLTVTIIGPTGTSLGEGTATVQFGGTPFFTATYPYTPDNNKVITGVVSASEMQNLIGNPSYLGLFYGISDNVGFLDISISVTAGTFLTPGQSYDLFEQSPINKTGVFYVGGGLATNSPPMKTGVLLINSEIPSPAGDGKYIGFSVNIQCVGGGSIIANGVVLQHS